MNLALLACDLSIEYMIHCQESAKRIFCLNFQGKRLNFDKVETTKPRKLLETIKFHSVHCLHDTIHKNADK